MSNTKPLVVILSLVYNHGLYVRDTLEGFVNQKTTFPFIAIVHDDASTDNSANIIREFEKKYPHIIKPIYESENQYSKKDGSLGRIMRKARDESGAKYVAMCEGDDYWTDPYKLQKQVDFLESHPEYSMCVTNYDVLRGDTGETISWVAKEERDLLMEDLIMEAWRYCCTASMVFRADLWIKIPKETNGLYVGDYPLCIYMRSVGNIRLLGKDNCCVYRYMSSGSWTERAASQNSNLKIIKENASKELYMLSVLDRMTNWEWHSMFKRREHIYLFTHYLKDYPTRAVMVFWRNPAFFYHNFSSRLLLEIHGLRQIKKVIKNIPLFSSLIKRYRN